MPRRSDAVVQIRSDRNEYHGNAYANSACDTSLSNMDGYRKCKLKCE